MIDRDRSCRAHALGFALDEPCSGGPHIHHVVLRSQGGGHDDDNLLLLCDHHHRLAHDHRRAEAETAGVIRRKEPPCTTPTGPETPEPAPDAATTSDAGATTRPADRSSG